MTKHIRTILKIGAARRLEAISITVLTVLFPVLAFAAAPFAGGTSALKSDLLTIVAPIAGLAIIAVGVICWFGKISWTWFAGLIVGVILVFGNDQVVSWVRGMFGV
jgi:type IV secretion system protein VirB2